VGIHEQMINGDVNWEDAFENAEVFEAGSAYEDLDIFKGERLDSLVGIPFMITSGTFRERMMYGRVSEFVTIKAIIPPVKVLEKRRVRHTENSLWFPEQVIGINDGSTGIRRQMVAYLHGNGYLEVIEPGSVLVEEGKRGVCSYDRGMMEWHSVRDGERAVYKTDQKSGTELHAWDFEIPNGLMIAKGIRVSPYEGEKGQESVTRYLA
jgi:hypothetical protein